jgi:hypothetical protein
MKRIVIWTILLALLGSAGATDTHINKDELYLKVSTSPDEIDLGRAIFFQGIHEVPGALTVGIESNWWHGPILLSTTPLKSRTGGKIEPENIFIRTSQTGQYVSLKKPVRIMPTAAGSQEVVVDFKVHAGLNNPSGQYKGTITLTVVPPV